MRRAPCTRSQGAAGRLQSTISPDFQRESVQTPGDRVEGLPWMGGASSCRLYVSWRGVCGTGAARDRDPRWGVAPGSGPS